MGKIGEIEVEAEVKAEDIQERIRIKYEKIGSKYKLIQTSSQSV